MRIEERAVCGADIKLYRYELLPSVMGEAKRLYEKGAAECEVVSSRLTNDGISGERATETPDGNLNSAFLLLPGNATAVADGIAIAARVATCGAIRSCCGIETSVHWPNEILMDGFCIGGVYTETHTKTPAEQYIVIGIHINVAETEHPVDNGLEWAALADRSGYADVRALEYELTDRLFAEYAALKRCGLAPLMPEYLRLCAAKEYSQTMLDEAYIPAWFAERSKNEAPHTRSRDGVRRMRAGRTCIMGQRHNNH